MRILIQRVSRASVQVDSEINGAIENGILAFVGIGERDTEREAEWLADKLSNIRIFEDSNGKMNLSLQDTGGAVLLISQFTLYGDARKGNRPNFLLAARPAEAEKLYQQFVGMMQQRLSPERVATGVFQAMMKVELVNEGPVTLLLEKEPQFP